MQHPNMYFVEVILPLSLAKTFTYRVSEAEFHFVKNGMRVVVPFGKSKMYTALIIDKHQNEPVLYEAKEINQILDEKPIVTEIQIAHWQWIASYYMCAIGDVYRGAMPSALLLESETIVSQNNPLLLKKIYFLTKSIWFIKPYNNKVHFEFRILLPY